MGGAFLLGEVNPFALQQRLFPVGQEAGVCCGNTCCKDSGSRIREVEDLFVCGFSGDAVVSVVEALEYESGQVAVGDAVDDIPAFSAGGDEPGESQFR